MKNLFRGRNSIFTKRLAVVAIVVAIPAMAGAVVIGEWKSGVVWPEPPVVTPGDNGSAPSDAVVLFDGTDMSQWNGGDAWKVADGAVTTTKRSISTKEAFGSCQFHLEFATPTKIEGTGQGRGNSGIFFGGDYEVQVLDSYENQTYFDGQCGALYKQSPPIVNPCRKPGEWQTYDIIYEAPQFGAYGELKSPAYLTVILNGVLVQNHVALKGGTFYNKPPSYKAHPEKMPIQLQFHGNDTRFRNIWIRENIAQHEPTLPETYDWQGGGEKAEEEAKKDKPQKKNDARGGASGKEEDSPSGGARSGSVN